MKKSVLLSLPVVLAFFVTLSISQTHSTFPKPPEPLDRTPTEKETITPTRRVDLAQLQREADDLARIAQTIPSDVGNVRKGMLPKDVIEKLKQIEKLSKHLRTQLNP